VRPTVEATLRVLLVSAYHTGSHAQWAQGYAGASRHEVSVVSHEGQFWKWRLSGAAPTLAEDIRRALADLGSPDVVLATSMVDLSGLLGLLRRELDVPVAVYMHENQVTYPLMGRTREEHRLGLITWMSLLAADGVAFNSDYHRDTLFETLPAFLRAFPDRRHLHLVDDVADKAVTLPVGVDLRRLDSIPRRIAEPPRIMWNHRWDPDKDPGLFLDMVGELAGSGSAFRLALAGERFANQAEEFGERIRALSYRVVADEHLPSDRYDALLREADLVVSTARQEHFGVSVVEAMHAGAFPILPDRLVYPERVPYAMRDRCLYRGRDQGVALMRRALDDIDATRRDAASLREVTEPFDWAVVAPRYDEWLGSITAS
jgi:glycosyltransferase involved in cell wall biosynthesis